MPVLPITAGAKGLDLSGRVVHSATVVASPAAAAETTICTVTIPDDIAIMLGVVLIGYAAFTVGTNGVSANLKLRQTNTSGTTIKASGAVTETAANLDGRSIAGVDTAGTAGAVYVLTLTVGSGSAASTVSAVSLIALAI
jgi:hypothetical protein